MTKYYTLITREDAAAPWRIAFGDYDRKCVEDECIDEYAQDGFETRIIATSDEQADIDNAVLCINAARDQS